VHESSDNEHRDRATVFVELLTSHQRKLYAYIATMLLGDSAAADVLQETNLQLWAHVNEFDFTRPFLPWAFGFARHRVLAFRKSCGRSRLVFGDDAVDLIHNQCMKSVSEADDRLIALRNCLEMLEPRQAGLIHERYVAKTPIRILAARSSDTAQNLSSRLYRIRKILARCIETKLAAGGHP
jgi:RNA polymerase sigma-70 factor (ECF subfamily)